MAGSGESDVRTPLLPASQPCDASDGEKELLPGCFPYLRKIFTRAVASAASSFGSIRKSITGGDRRRLIHSFKMGLAILCAFLLVLLKTPYELLGTHAIWAIMTVIVVFEGTVGATLSKGFNRGLGTLVAGLLAVAVVEIACRTGSIGHPTITGVSAFIVGVVVTFLKNGATVKSYEYGFRIFLVTFSLIMVSGYRQQDPVNVAVHRVLAIVIGGVIGLFINVFILPIWAGEDLHQSIADHFESVADSLEVCVKEYLRGATLERVPTKILMGQAADDPVYKGYRAALMSASNEESLANFASWEPPHGKFRLLHYPWMQYVKVGAVLRHCTYSIVALHGCLRSAIQAPLYARKIFEKELCDVSVEVAKVLKSLGQQVSKMQRSKPEDVMENVHCAVERLHKSIYLHSYLLVTRVTQEMETLEEDINQLSVGTSPGYNTGVNILPRGRLERTYSANMQGTFAYPQENLNGMISTGYQKLHSWPARSTDDLKFPSNSMFEERVRVLESASALSLGTFSTLLIEVAVRLQYVVEAVEELSVLAKFKEDEIWANEEGKVNI